MSEMHGRDAELLARIVELERQVSDLKRIVDVLAERKLRREIERRREIECENARKVLDDV